MQNSESIRSAFSILHSELPYRSHPAELGLERNGAVPGVRTVDHERLADQQVALDVMVGLINAVAVLRVPVAAVGALRAVVAQRQELVVVQRELDAAAAFRAKQALRRVPLRRITENVANLLGA